MRIAMVTGRIARSLPKCTLAGCRAQGRSPGTHGCVAMLVRRVSCILYPEIRHFFSSASEFLSDCNEQLPSSGHYGRPPGMHERQQLVLSKLHGKMVRIPIKFKLFLIIFPPLSKRDMQLYGSFVTFCHHVLDTTKSHNTNQQINKQVNPSSQA